MIAICRVIQELNVALGGTLLQNVHEIAGRHDHRGNGNGSIDIAYGPKHMVRLSGALARLVGVSEIMVNSLHGQAVDRPGDGLVVNAVAEDGTIEAVSAPNAPGFVLGACSGIPNGSGRTQPRQRGDLPRLQHRSLPRASTRFEKGGIRWIWRPSPARRP